LLTHTRASVRIYTRARPARERERERGGETERERDEANIWQPSGTTDMERCLNAICSYTSALHRQTHSVNRKYLDELSTSAKTSPLFAHSKKWSLKKNKIKTTIVSLSRPSSSLSLFFFFSLFLPVSLVIAKDGDRADSQNSLTPYPELLNPRSINLLIGDYGVDNDRRYNVSLQWILISLFAKLASRETHDWPIDRPTFLSLSRLTFSRARHNAPRKIFEI